MSARPHLIRPRILLATVRHLGTCPCPRCLVDKPKICDLGNVHDRKRRQTRKRLDNNLRKSYVEAARRLIYKQGKGLKSTFVELFLFPQSMVATRVSSMLRDGFAYWSFFRMHFRLVWGHLEWIFMNCLCRIYYMNSNWEFGKPFFLI